MSVEPPGLAYICEGLKEQRKGLVTLVLWNNQLTHTGMAFLGMTLVSAGRSIPIRLLGLPSCKFETHTHAHDFVSPSSRELNQK